MKLLVKLSNESDDLDKHLNKQSMSRKNENGFPDT